MAVTRMTVRKPGYLARYTSDFHFANAAAAQRTNDIAGTFLAGYNILAAGGTERQVTARASGVPRYFLPFFYEGAAMGFGPFSWHTGCSTRGFEAFTSSLSPSTVYQNYVGFGWWLATIYHRRPHRIARIVSALDFRYRLLCYEGMGFRAGFLSAGRQRNAAEVRRGDATAEHVWHQGFGRSLWFVHMGDISAAVRSANTIEQNAGDCISGLGLGVAFSYLDQIADLDLIFRNIPANLLAEFEQGLSFGWEARQLADPQLFDAHVAVLTPDFRQRVEQSVADVRRLRDCLMADGHETDFYYRWRQSLIELRRTAATRLVPPRPAQLVEPGSPRQLKHLSQYPSIN
jgi:enediyne biosynthesis protein E3